MSNVAHSESSTGIPPSRVPQSLVIVGGGMVGLTLALRLAQQGRAVTVLEAGRYPQTAAEVYHPSFDARNTALSRRTVQVFRALGLWDRLQVHATPILQVRISEQGSFGKASLRADEEQIESFGQVIENAWLGQVLLQAVREQPQITLREQVRVTGLSQSDTHVTLTAEQDSAVQQMTADLVLAADGRDSVCRQLLGIGAAVHDYQQVALVTTVQTDRPHQQVAFERFSDQGPLALLPLPDQPSTLDQGRRSVVWTVASGTEQQWLGADADERFLQALQQSFGDRAGRFVRTGARFAYPLVQVLAERQVEGRVVLMGNAAHTLHPVAGQGFNLCIRDVDVLCRMLAQAGSAASLSALLRDYEQARQVDQRRVALFCDGVVRGFTHRNPLLRVARNLGLLAFDVLPGAKPLLASYAMGLKT